MLNPLFFAVEFNYEVLCKALEQLSDFESKANARVIESGVLKGLNLEDIKRAGERLIFQDGCTSFFQKIVKNENLKANVHVLSYCWCADLIRSAFSSGISLCLCIELLAFAFQNTNSFCQYLLFLDNEVKLDFVAVISYLIENCLLFKTQTHFGKY